MSDLISRQEVIDELEERLHANGCLDAELVSEMNRSIGYIMRLPSLQPEIIRCKDCKYNDYEWRRLSIRWLPCMDVRTGSDWYCGSAERKGD